MLRFISTHRIQFGWMAVAALAAVLLGGGMPYNIVLALKTVAVALGISAVFGFGLFNSDDNRSPLKLTLLLACTAGVILYMAALLWNWNMPKPLDVGVWAASMGLIVTATIRRLMQG